LDRIVRLADALAAPLAAARRSLFCSSIPRRPGPSAGHGAIAQLSVYTTPTDALLSDLDVVDATPAVGCTDAASGARAPAPVEPRDGG